MFDACTIRYIDSTTLFNTRVQFQPRCNVPADGEQLAVDERNIDGKINIYVTPNSVSRQAGNDRMLCTSDDMFPNRSWTFRPANGGDNVLRQHIVLNSSNVQITRTLGHEIGHWFGLLHTHGASSNRPPIGVETDELVDGSNCDIAGDFTCDTPADPNLAGRVASSPSCLYTDNELLTDSNGDLFTPDTQNRMSIVQVPVNRNGHKGKVTVCELDI